MRHKVYTFKATNYENTYVTVEWEDARASFEVSYTGPPEASGFTTDLPEGQLLPYDFCVNTTLHQFKIKHGFPYATHHETENATECQLAVCTLKVRLPVLIQKASDISAPDGVATVEYDGYGAQVRYSLDNVTFQASNVFPNLAPGSYTVYIWDQDPAKPEAEQCRDQANFVMSYVIVYNPRFCLGFDNVLADRVYQLNINQKSYRGLCESVCGSGTPITVQYAKRTNIVATKALMSFTAQSRFHFAELYSADERGHRVDLLENGQLEWRGYVLPEIWGQDFADMGYYVQVTATDGLATLKNFLYLDENDNRFTGKRSLLNIIFDCLDKLDLDLPLQTGIDILEKNMREAVDLLDANPIIADPLFQASVDTANFYDEKGPWNCEKVLKHVLETFDATLTQSQGRWQVEALDAKRTAVFCSNYAADRTFTGYSLVNPLQIRQLPNTGYPQWINQVPHLEILPAAKKITINSDLLVIDNIVVDSIWPNAAFANDNNLVNFIGSAPVQRVVTSEKEGRNAVKFTQSADTFANARYQESKPFYLLTDNASNTGLYLKIDYLTDRSNEAILPGKVFFKLDGAGFSFTNQGWVPASATTHYEFDNVQGNTVQSFEVQLPPIPATGNYTLRLYEVTGASFIRYDKVTLALLPAGRRPLEAQSVEIVNPARYTWVPEAKEVLFTDVPLNPNYANIFRNYIEVNGQQSQGWHYRGQTDLNLLLNILGAQRAYQYSRPQHTLLGALQGHFRYGHVLREPYNFNRLFAPENLTIDYRAAESEGLFKEIITVLTPTTGVILRENGAKIMRENGGALVREATAL